MTTRHSKSRQNLDFSKTLNRESFAREKAKLKVTRNGDLRASVQHAQSTSNLNNSSLYHKKRNSCSSYSSFLNLYQHRKEKEEPTRVSKLKMGLQNFTIKDEIEEEDEEIPEEGISPSQETASAALKCYNSKRLSNNPLLRSKDFGKNILHQSHNDILNSTLNQVPLTMKLKKPTDNKKLKNEFRFEKPFSRQIFKGAEPSRQSYSHIEEFSIKTYRGNSTSYLQLETEHIQVEDSLHGGECAFLLKFKS